MKIFRSNQAMVACINRYNSTSITVSSLTQTFLICISTLKLNYLQGLSTGFDILQRPRGPSKNNF